VFSYELHKLSFSNSNPAGSFLRSNAQNQGKANRTF
jgi:hypothetical protein